MIPRFTVLLSIYKPNMIFLEDQLLSLSMQNGVDIELLVRFDGTSLQVQRQVVSRLESLQITARIFSGKNIGACASYFELLSLSGNDSFLAFCDYDDVWHPNRLIDCVPKLSNGSATLVVVGMQPINANSRFEDFDFTSEPNYSYIESPSFQNAIVENIYQGARMALNPAAIDILKSSLPDPENVIMHDAWIYLVMSSEAQIVHESKTLFYYRQHDSNLIGLSAGSLHHRMRRFLVGKFDLRFRMAEEFYKRFPDSLNSNAALTFSRIPQESRLSRLRTLLDLRVSRQKRRDFFLMLLAIVFF